MAAWVFCGNRRRCVYGHEWHRALLPGGLWLICLHACEGGLHDTDPPTHPSRGAKEKPESPHQFCRGKGGTSGGVDRWGREGGRGWGGVTDSRTKFRSQAAHVAPLSLFPPPLPYPPYTHAQQWQCSQCTGRTESRSARKATPAHARPPSAPLPTWGFTKSPSHTWALTSL